MMHTNQDVRALGPTRSTPSHPMGPIYFQIRARIRTKNMSKESEEEAAQIISFSSLRDAMDANVLSLRTILHILVMELEIQLTIPEGQNFLLHHRNLLSLGCMRTLQGSHMVPHLRQVPPHLPCGILLHPLDILPQRREE